MEIPAAERDIENHTCTVSNGGRKILKLHFADIIDGLAGKEEEQATLTSRINQDAEI